MFKSLAFSINRGRALRLAMAVLAVGACPGLAAAVSCGANITVDTVLSSDLACASPPALTVTSAQLDLNGFNVKPTTGDGGYLKGAGAKLLNGGVQSTNDGVILYDEGKHLVRNVVSRLNSGKAFYVVSDGNTFDHAVASYS